MSFVSINPATGQRLSIHRAFASTQISAAMAKAHAAFLGWRELSPSGRASHLRAVARVLREQGDELARLAAEEMGKPVAQGRAEVEKCAGVCEFYARHARDWLADQRPSGAPQQAHVTFEPLGVILAIMPWNFPFWQAFRAAAPALMAGNTMVLKHAGNVAACALAIEQVFVEAEVPAGLFQNLLVSSKEIPALIADPRIRGITLTGSTEAGRSVAAAAGKALKPVVLELGGSDPYLILADADLDRAAETCAEARLLNSGQSCVCAKRFIVVESVRRAFEKKFVARLAARRVGDPLAPDTDVGPLARHDLRDALHGQVVASLKRGARLLLGGKIPKGAGFFYPPTALTDVRKGMPAYAEELFGPVAAIIPVRDEEAAIATANETIYGLGAAIFTRDRRRAREIVPRLDAGMVFVNACVRSDAALPFGGTKQSGHGRELGIDGLRSFVNAKTVWVS
ncbi:MAG TPA: NAD-dependent succinate-semialdehyde dehydrogenase [Opitutaceae bacterium]|nr:NAD-dependent succinate-semialdehyde dehydrogenase [Opitutaceae bacterium]